MNLYMTIYTVYNRDINTARHTDTCRKVHLRKEVSAARAQAQPGARSASCRCGWGLALLRCAADVHTAHGAAQRRSGLLVWFLRILSRSAGRTGRTQPQLGRSRGVRALSVSLSVCLRPPPQKKPPMMPFSLRALVSSVCRYSLSSSLIASESDSRALTEYGPPERKVA